jgi:hypothetical protein
MKQILVKEEFSADEIVEELSIKLKPIFVYYVERHMEQGLSYQQAKKKFLDKIDVYFGD